MRLHIDHDVCNLCGRCVEECPYNALEESQGRIRPNEKCNFCGACVETCPADAVWLEPDAAEEERGARGHTGVWVYGEHHDGRLHPVVFELIGKGRELARARRCPLEVVLMGHGIADVAGQLAGLPVSAVRLVDHPALAQYRDGPHSRALARLIAQFRPEVVLAGATARGRSLMPRVAVLCHTGLTADCTALEIDPLTGNLRQTRPAFGGNIMATIITRDRRPQMATVRPRVMSTPRRDGSAAPPIRRWTPADELMADAVEILALEKTAAESVNIAAADVLVAGGRGVGGPEGFELLRRVAGLLGGEVAASRAAVDAGWVPYSRQVGQTGKTVQPDLYLAVGISGSVQHRAGMQSAGTIVAVNTDPEAPIFGIADYGIVGDYREVLPELVRIFEKEAARE